MCEERRRNENCLEGKSKQATSDCPITFNHSMLQFDKRTRKENFKNYAKSICLHKINKKEKEKGIDTFVYKSTISWQPSEPPPPFQHKWNKIKLEVKSDFYLKIACQRKVKLNLIATITS